MADECDIAEATEQIERDALFSMARKAVLVPIPVEYQCRECGDATDGRRWCNSDCCRAWQQRQQNWMV